MTVSTVVRSCWTASLPLFMKEGSFTEGDYKEISLEFLHEFQGKFQGGKDKRTRKAFDFDRFGPISYIARRGKRACLQ